MAMSVTYTTVAGMLMMENRGGVETEYISDPLGNLIQCLDMNGNKIYEAWYWSYGEIREETGTNPSPWGFVGLLGYYTDALNFLYVRARYYRPNLTRWQTVDPLWPREFSYRYASLQPVTFVDPKGLFGGPCSWQQMQGAQDDCYAQGGKGVVSCTAYDLCLVTVVIAKCGGPNMFGDCTPEKQRALQAAVRASCDQKRACSQNDNCDTIGSRIILGIECIVARTEINSICYGGGDPGHITAIAQARAALLKCERIFHEKHCHWL